MMGNQQQQQPQQQGFGQSTFQGSYSQPLAFNNNPFEGPVYQSGFYKK